MMGSVKRLLQSVMMGAPTHATTNTSVTSTCYCVYESPRRSTHVPSQLPQLSPADPPLATSSPTPDTHPPLPAAGDLATAATGGGLATAARRQHAPLPALARRSHKATPHSERLRSRRCRRQDYSWCCCCCRSNHSPWKGAGGVRTREKGLERARLRGPSFPPPSTVRACAAEARAVVCSVASDISREGWQLSSWVQRTRVFNNVNSLSTNSTLSLNNLNVTTSTIFDNLHTMSTNSILSIVNHTAYTSQI